MIFLPNDIVNYGNICRFVLSYAGNNINSIMHALLGYRSIGYRIAVWNCRRGLLNSDGSPSNKINDIKLYIQKHNLHIFGIIESDLHWPTSRIGRPHPLSTLDIDNKLPIDSYRINVPQTWYHHDQARLIMYVREDIKIYEVRGLDNYVDLPSIRIDISLGREKKTTINIFYREFTNGMYGLSDSKSQLERLERQINHWRLLFSTGWDVFSDYSW